MRKLLAALSVVSMIAGCDGSSLNLPKASTSNITSMGSAIVTVSGSARETQAQIADVNTLEVSLTSVQQPITNIITKAQIASGTASASFPAIPAGLATFAVHAFDINHADIGRATASAMINGGQTSNVAIALKLDPTFVAPASGSANAQITIINGDQIASPSASGSYDPLADTITRFDINAFTSNHPTDPNMVRATVTLFARNSSGLQVKWTSGNVRLEYTVFQSSYSNTTFTGDPIVASGSLWFSTWQDARTIDLPRAAGKYGITNIKATLPGGGIVVQNSLPGINLFN